MYNTCMQCCQISVIFNPKDGALAYEWKFFSNHFPLFYISTQYNTQYCDEVLLSTHPNVHVSDKNKKLFFSLHIIIIACLYIYSVRCSVDSVSLYIYTQSRYTFAQ
jgi:hypothetical protein